MPTYYNLDVRIFRKALDLFLLLIRRQGTPEIEKFDALLKQPSTKDSHGEEMQRKD